MYRVALRTAIPFVIGSADEQVLGDRRRRARRRRRRVREHGQRRRRWRRERWQRRRWGQRRGTGGAGGSGGAGGNGGSGGAGGSGGEPDYVSGSRIKARTISTADGAKAFAGFYDTNLSLPCSFNRATDDSLRCLPAVTAYAGTYWGDSNCSTTPLAYSLGCVSTYASRAESTSTCVDVGGYTNYARTHIYSVGNTFAGTVYVGSARLVHHGLIRDVHALLVVRGFTVDLRGRYHRQRAVEALPSPSCRSLATKTPSTSARASRRSAAEVSGHRRRRASSPRLVLVGAEPSPTSRPRRRLGRGQADRRRGGRRLAAQSRSRTSTPPPRRRGPQRWASPHAGHRLRRRRRPRGSCATSGCPPATRCRR